jgi:hypothetical protein
MVEHDEPATYNESMEGPESEKWLETIKSQIRSTYDNQVWTLIDIPNDRKAVENKWIFRKKTDADGNVIVYKARLVATISDIFKELTMMRPSIATSPLKDRVHVLYCASPWINR